MGSNYQTARENYDRYSYARDNGHLDFVELATKCDDYVRGNQWDAATRSRLERRGKPVITINKALPTIAAIMGEQLDNRADISFRPSQGGNPEVALALEKIWLHIANDNDLDWLETQVSLDGFVRGRGFYDLRLKFSDNMQGEVSLDLLNSKNVVIDPDADSYDPDRWNEVFITKWLSYDDIATMYGKSYAKELENRSAHSFELRYDSLDWLPDRFGGSTDNTEHLAGHEVRNRRIYRVIERQYRERRMQECFVDRATGSTRAVPDGWDRERIAAVAQTYNLGIYKKEKNDIKWVVSTDSVTLHDKWSPLPHFTTIPFFPFFMHGKPVGLIENIISIQDLLNKTVSQELHIINTTANSGYKVKAGAMTNMTLGELEERGGEDGLVVELTDIAGLDKLKPNQVPTGLDRVSFKADEFLKEVSMISDSMRGFDRADVAAKAIKAKQARGSISLAMPFDNLAQTRKILARNTLDLIQQFYTEERLYNITGNNLTDEPEQLIVNQTTPEGEIINDLTIGKYDVVLTLVPARDTLEQTQFQEAMEMRTAGIAVPDDVIVEHSHMLRKSEIAKRIKEANGGGEPSEQQQQQMQMEQQMMQLELAEKQAEVQLKQASAQLSQAKAAAEASAAQGGPSQELAMKREEAAARLAFEREKFVKELQLKREQIAAELALKREGAREDQFTKRTTSLMDLETKREIAKQNNAGKTAKK